MDATEIVTEAFVFMFQIELVEKVAKCFLLPIFEHHESILSSNWYGVMSMFIQCPSYKDIIRLIF